MKQILDCIWFVNNKLNKLFGRKRKLRGTWTIESMPELRAVHGMDVEEELIAAIVDEINKDRNN